MLLDLKGYGKLTDRDGKFANHVNRAITVPCAGHRLVVKIDAKKKSRGRFKGRIIVARIRNT